MKVAFQTLGCRVNSYESEAMTEKFKKEGFEVVDFSDKADVYVINTCTVTNMGDKKSRQAINKAKKANPDSVVAVVGCYSQTSPDEVSNIEGVDVVLGTRNKGDIVYWANRAMAEKNQFVEVNDVLRNKEFEELEISEYQDRTRAFVKIQDGCNRFCTFCLIPFARGTVCSKDPKKVIEEVKILGENGFKEVILSGIHIASYGMDLDEQYELADLLEEVEKVEGIERVRIGSIDPTYFTKEVVDRISKLKKLCPHYHLSLQSGCDKTLKRMNRRYTVEQYIDIVKNLREKIKDVSITTDLIVGFPGETDEDFETTLNFVKDIKLSKIHVFKYSPRKGTRAATFDDDVHGTIKEERSKAIIAADRKNEEDFAEKYVGKTVKVLFEEKVKGKEGFYSGYTENYIKVMAESDEDISGLILDVDIKENHTIYLEGSLVKERI